MAKVVSKLGGTEDGGGALGDERQRASLVLSNYS